MAYYLNLFTPETWAKYLEHGSVVSGFRKRQRKSAERLKPGDTFLCYIVKVSRWAGSLEILSHAFEDDAPIFAEPDPYRMRFRVKPIVTLPLEQAIPIDAEGLWENLSFTREMEKRVSGWAQHANLRASLRKIPAADAKLILNALDRQAEQRKFYPLSQAERYPSEALKRFRLRRAPLSSRCPMTKKKSNYRLQRPASTMHASRIRYRPHWR